MDDIIAMAREAGFNPVAYMGGNLELFERFAALVDKEAERKASFDKAELWLKRINEAVLAEREACAEKTGEFARKWWSIHCESNKHMETTLKAHQDFCALQAAIRARKTT